MFKIKLVPATTAIKFMRFHRAAFAGSAAAALISIVLLLIVGLNFGIDFRGGILIEARTPGVANLAAMRSSLSGLGLGEVALQGFGQPTDVLIRVELQEGGDAAQQTTVNLVKEALARDIGQGIDYRRVEVVGPKVSAELIRAGALALVLAIGAMLVYIWFRFEWQFSLGAVAALVHDVVLTIGLFALTGLDFNLATIAAILTIIGYSMNDTVVIYDRVRENLRKYKTMNLAELLDRSVNDTLSRTVVTSVTTLLALVALRFIGGEVIESFTVAMMWGERALDGARGSGRHVFLDLRRRPAAHLPQSGRRHRARGCRRRGPGRRGLIARLAARKGGRGLVDSFKVSNDPAFAEKVEDVVGLYLDPPDKAVVFSVDEKSQIQALDRSQPGLPMKKGRAGTMTHDYKRHGTTTLFAALNLLDGKVIGHCMKRHRHQEFIRFLNRIDRQTLPYLDIHLIIDNYATHKTPAVKRWLKKHPRFHIHFTPTSASWLNMVERFFAEITRKRIRRGVFKSVAELEQAIYDYLAIHNHNPVPFVSLVRADSAVYPVQMFCAETMA